MVSGTCALRSRSPSRSRSRGRKNGTIILWSQSLSGISSSRNTLYVSLPQILRGTHCWSGILLNVCTAVVFRLCCLLVDSYLYNFRHGRNKQSHQILRSLHNLMLRGHSIRVCANAALTALQIDRSIDFFLYVVSYIYPVSHLPFLQRMEMYYQKHSLGWVAQPWIALTAVIEIRANFFISLDWVDDIINLGRGGLWIIPISHHIYTCTTILLLSPPNRKERNLHRVAPIPSLPPRSPFRRRSSSNPFRWWVFTLSLRLYSTWNISRSMSFCRRMQSSIRSRRPLWTSSLPRMGSQRHKHHQQAWNKTRDQWWYILAHPILKISPSSNMALLILSD